MSTSKEAYDHINTSGKAAQLRHQVIKSLAAVAGTASEIVYRLGVPRDSISPRLAELNRMGIANQIRTRTCTISGRRCIVWSLGGVQMKKKKSPYERGFDAGYQQAMLELSPKEEPK